MDRGTEKTPRDAYVSRVNRDRTHAGVCARWILLGLAGLLVSSCALDDAQLTDVPAGGRIKYDSPMPETLPDDPDIIKTTMIQEDFDSRRQLALDRNENVTVDVNQGLVFLPAIKLPKEVTAPEMTDAIKRLQTYEGSVQGKHILIEDHVDLQGDDSVEITSSDSIRVTGSISAGNGGITLLANQSIHIDGSLRSSGPIRLRVAQPGGRISVTGLIESFNTEEVNSADISLLTRGTIEISGTLQTGDTMNASSGNIEMVSYGDLIVTRNTTRIVSGSAKGGNAGNVSLSSESTLQITDGSHLTGGSASSMNVRGEKISAGNILIRVQDLQIGESVSLNGGDCSGCAGGHVDAIVANNFTLNKFGQLLGGDGKDGGDVSLKVGSAEIGKGSIMIAGAGNEHAGRIFIDTPNNLQIDADAQIQGGEGRCSDGGPVVGLVGQTLILNPGSMIKGGRSQADDSQCVAASRGGDIQIFCRDLKGSFDETSVAGNGAPSGATTIQIKPDYERPAPIPHPENSGFVESKVFDRGVQSLNMAANLISEQAELPDGTRIDLLLCGAVNVEGPFNAWIPANSQGVWNDDFNSFRYVKYKVALHGRALDTPVLDRFVIDLAPSL